MKTLIVVSGGDAPGINAAIGHYTAIAAQHGHEVYGASGGFPGLLAGRIAPITYEGVMAWMGRAGSLLESSRDPVLKDPAAHAVLRERLHGYDNVLLFGGNGTLRYIPPLLQTMGIPSVGIPTTIDNDVPGTETTLGFDSACNYAYISIDGALLTAHALRGRLFMVETLGGNAGYLALAVAHGAGAHAVILPEYDYPLEWLAERLKRAAARDGYALLVITEGAKGARTLADELPPLTGIRMRDVRLGHAQRGANPTHRDRVLAADMAYTAFHDLLNGVSMGIAVVRGSKVVLHEGTLEGVEIAPPDEVLYRRINGLS
jgi:6-phosphofructokinase 1